MITLRDLSNIAASACKSDTRNNLTSFVKTLKEKYNANVDVLMDAENNLQGLFFQDVSMHSVYNAYPEFLCMDATYKLLEIRLPVYILLCEDGAGESEIAAVGLLAREDAASLSWFIERFKSYNISWPKTNVFMTDKDLNERDVLRGAFPGVSLLLCLFHTLRTFSREITTAKLGITSGERISSLEFIQKLAYATSEKNYDELYRLFVSSAPSTVIDYYNNNWHNIHDEWVFGLKFVSRNLMNSTNNRLENFNGKLKEVIDCNSSLENFLDKFYVVLTSMRNERDHRTIFQMQKVSVDVFDPNSAEAAYKKVLTLYAARHVLKQMSLFKEIILLPGEHGQFIVNSHEGSHIVTSNFCSCMFRKSMNLPCRHIYAARQLLGINLFDTELCSERWTLKYYRQHQRAFSTQVTDGKPGAVDFHVAPKVKLHSQHEKFKLAIQETTSCYPCI
nr:zinc finger SWIM domain-containing protein 1-like [Hydra vulgaris]